MKAPTTPALIGCTLLTPGFGRVFSLEDKSRLVEYPNQRIWRLSLTNEENGSDRCVSLYCFPAFSPCTLLLRQR
jgi:hypothetical protein